MENLSQRIKQAVDEMYSNPVKRVKMKKPKSQVKNGMVKITYKKPTKHEKEFSKN
jgi:hypothetical protein